MTTHIEITIPVYRADRYEQLERQGKITVSSVVNTLEEGDLTEGYNRLKKEIDILIAEMNTKTRLADEVYELEDQIRWKSQTLKDILKDIEKATEHYNSLKALLESFGVVPKSRSLTFDTDFLLSQAGSQVQLTPTQTYSGEF